MHCAEVIIFFKTSMKCRIYGIIVPNRCSQHSTSMCSSRQIKPTLLKL